MAGGRDHTRARRGQGRSPKKGEPRRTGLSARFRPDGCYARKPTVPAVLSAVVASGGLAFAVLAGLDSSPPWQVARVVVVIAAIALAVWLTRRAGRPGRGNGFAARGQPARWAAPSTPPTRPRGGHDPATAHLPPTFSHRMPNAELRSRVPSGCAVRIAAADALLTSSPSGPLAHAFSTSLAILAQRVGMTPNGPPAPVLANPSQEADRRSISTTGPQARTTSRYVRLHPQRAHVRKSTITAVPCALAPPVPVTGCHPSPWPGFARLPTRSGAEYDSVLCACGHRIPSSAWRRADPAVRRSRDRGRRLRSSPGCIGG